MKSLFIKDDFEAIIKRLNNMTARSERQWGKMEINQMLRHCRRGLDLADGTRQSPQPFIYKLISPFFKSLVTNDKPFRHGSPSPAGSIEMKTGTFDAEKSRLLEKITQFHNKGEAGCHGTTHAFFGRLSATEWGSLMYKHLDHHLRQFGG